MVFSGRRPKLERRPSMGVAEADDSDRKVFLTQVFRRLLPQFVIVTAAVTYLLLGGYIFYVIESKWEEKHGKNAHSAASEKVNITLLKSENLTTDVVVVRYCADDDLMRRLQQASQACNFRHEKNTNAVRILQEKDALDPLYAQCEKALSALAPCFGQASNALTPHPEWSWTTGVILAFTIVTTVGYGEIVPRSPAGRLFCIIYGIFGIPLVLLALANQGRFFSSWLLAIYKKGKKLVKCCKVKCGRGGDKRLPPKKGAQAEDAVSMASSEEAMERTIPATVLLCLVFAYLALGGLLIRKWESRSEWTFVDSTYFVFTSASSIGFGDLVPSNRESLVFTFLYICFGLALTTTAIDIFAEYLRKLHYWGAKIRNVASTFVWFGGTKVTINQLVRTIGHELGASEDKIKTLVRHMDSVVNIAIQEAADQNEVVEDIVELAPRMQIAECLVQSADERLLVHESSVEFGIAEASLLSPVILKAGGDACSVVVDNNNFYRRSQQKRASAISLLSVKSDSAATAHLHANSCPKPRLQQDVIEFIDSPAGNVTQHHTFSYHNEDMQSIHSDVSHDLVTFPSE